MTLMDCERWQMDILWSQSALCIITKLHLKYNKKYDTKLFVIIDFESAQNQFRTDLLVAYSAI